MRLPFLSEPYNTSKKVVGVFGGYNHNLTIGDDEFYDMKNMSSDNYPALSPRKTRGKEIRTFIKPNGIFAKDKLGYVDGTKFYYDGEEKGTVLDSEKVFVSMGAYVLIWPDKAYYNTFKDEFGTLERSWSQTTSVRFAKVNDSTFIKITCTGINDGFNKYDAVTISGCTKTELNKTAIIQDIDKDFIVVIADIGSDFTQSSGLKISRDIPAMDFVTEKDNRIYGCSNEKHEIYASKLGDPFNWNCYEGISTDSYTATVGSDGNFTGIVSHLGYVLFFKENCMHKLFGSKPSNFQITTNNIRGVSTGNEKSICLVNETLFYCTRNEVVGFDGSMPYSVSDALGQEQYKNVVASRVGNKYYMSAEDYKGEKTLLVFDTKLQTWHKEDSTRFKHAIYANGELYYIGDDLVLRTITGDAEERIEWFIETGDMLEGSLDNKYISKLQINCTLEKGSMLDVFTKSDVDIDWVRVTTIHSLYRRTYTIPVVPHRGQTFKIKLLGIGECKIFAMSKTIERGSEL